MGGAVEPHLARLAVRIREFASGGPLTLFERGSDVIQDDPVDFKATNPQFQITIHNAQFRRLCSIPPRKQKSRQLASLSTVRKPHSDKTT